MRNWRPSGNKPKAENHPVCSTVDISAGYRCVNCREDAGFTHQAGERQRGDEKKQKRIYDLYLKSTKFINNWDLVDMSVEHIVGGWLADKPALRKRVLTRLAKSSSLWERRIAILATFHYTKMVMSQKPCASRGYC